MEHEDELREAVTQLGTALVMVLETPELNRRVSTDTAGVRDQAWAIVHRFWKKPT